MTRSSAQRRYYLRLGAAMTIYLLSLFAADWLIEDRGLEGIAAYFVAAIPGLATASIFWIIARLILEQRDEFLRLLYVRMSLVATGFAMSLASVWGFLEVYGLIFHLEAFWWPALWCLGLGIGAVFNKITLGAAGCR